MVVSAWPALASTGSISRRQFGKWVGLMLAGAAGLAAVARPAWLGTLFARQESLREMSLASFASVVGTKFRLHTESGVVMDLTLTAAMDLTTKDGECFSISFLGSESGVLSQGTYLFAHPDFGHFPLFIVPGVSSSGGQRYVAIINRQSAS